MFNIIAMQLFYRIICCFNQIYRTPASDNMKMISNHTNELMVVSCLLLLLQSADDKDILMVARVES